MRNSHGGKERILIEREVVPDWEAGQSYRVTVTLSITSGNGCVTAELFLH